MATKPQVSSGFARKELDKAEAQLDNFEKSLKKASDTDINSVPQKELEPAKLSTKEKYEDAPYIKSIKTVSSKEPFNEKWRDEYNKSWEYVKCIVENLEFIGNNVELWTKGFPGEAAHFWSIPCNKPVYVPRMVAKNISNCKYKVLTMNPDNHSPNNMVPSASRYGEAMYGTPVVTEVKNRVSCIPAGASF